MTEKKNPLSKIDLSNLLQQLLSHDPTLISRFCLLLAPQLGELGLPVHSRSMWYSVLHDMENLLDGKAVKYVVACKPAPVAQNSRLAPARSQRVVVKPRKFLDFEEDAESAPMVRRVDEYSGLKFAFSARAPVFFATDDPERLIQCLRSAVSSAADSFTAAERTRLTEIFKTSVGCTAFLERWSKKLAATIGTPVKVGLNRLLLNVAQQQISRGFAGLRDAGVVEKKEELETAWREATDWKSVDTLLWGGVADVQKVLGAWLALPAGMDAVNLISKSLADLRESAGRILEFGGDEKKKTAREAFADRDSEHARWPSLLALMDDLKRRYRVFHPLWDGIKLYPEVQRRWRAHTAAYELTHAVRFGGFRAVLHLAGACAKILVNNSAFSDAWKGEEVHKWTPEAAVQVWALEAAASSFQRRSVNDMWSGIGGQGSSLNWTSVLRRIAPDCSDRREFLLSRFETPAFKKQTLLTDGVDVKICGKVNVPTSPWLAKDSSKEVVLLANGLIGIAKALGVDLRPELWRRVQLKADGKLTTVLDSEALWSYIKKETLLQKDAWCAAVFGEPNPEQARRARSMSDLELKYTDLKKHLAQGTNWCRKSKVTGQVPATILSEIRGDQIDTVPAIYCDTGRVNVVAGVWRVVEEDSVALYSHRVTGAYYHHRIGANRVRAQVEARGAGKLSQTDRVSTSQARQRRLVEEGKRQLFHEIVASWRLFSDRKGDGRDFVVIIEHSSGGGVGGNAHRAPACKELQEFLGEFLLVGTTSGHNTSQMSSRTGHRMEFANKREIRTKVERSISYTGADGKEHFYYDDRDINAGVNFMLIDEAEARGEGRPKRFQSTYYKKKKEGDSSISPQARQ